MSKLHSKDILFASFVNHIFELPFFVTADHETSSIVIAIRGSLSMRDIFTDLTAVVEKLDAYGVPPDSYVKNKTFLIVSLLKTKNIFFIRF
jgi:sn1-specific diacylglycerol lipase